MMPEPIRVAILDNHSQTLDRYHTLLAPFADLALVWSLAYSADLLPRLDRNPVDAIILDVNVPISPDDARLYPVLDAIPALLARPGALAVLVVTMRAESRLIKGVMAAGAAAYILKDDGPALTRLDQIIRDAVAGDLYLTALAADRWRSRLPVQARALEPRHWNLLAQCRAHPRASVAELAGCLEVPPVVVRRQLSEICLHLGVSARAAAVEEAERRGNLP